MKRVHSRNCIPVFCGKLKQQLFSRLKNRLLVAGILIGGAVMAGEFVAQAAASEVVLSESGARTRVRMNFDWKFCLGDPGEAQSLKYDDAGWQTVNLPHDWSIYGPFNQKVAMGGANGLRPRGIGWYRKTFLSPSPGRVAFLDFEGVYTEADVWLNGIHLGKNHNGYLGFRFNITGHLKPAGESNVLAVRVDNSRVGSSRWYTGSGIYRDVYLVTTSPVHIPQYGTWITTPQIEQEKAVVHVETVVTNSGSSASEMTLATEIYDPAGKLVASATKAARLESGGVSTVKLDFTVPQPQRWSTESPRLYRSVSRVEADRKPCDAETTTFGIRTVEFTPERGLLLNGKKVNIKGVNFHHDLGCLGAAAFERGFERRLELIKQMGCNAVRLAHNPYQPSLLDQCDRMGILVFNEAYDKWSDQFTGPEHPFEKAWPTELRSFVLRDRNHPSVFIWSVGNETRQQMTAPDFGVVQFKAMYDLVKSIDPTRAVTCALFPARAKGVRYNVKPNTLFQNSEPAEMSFAMDVVSCNYTHSFFARDHQKHPRLIFLLSEVGTNGGGDNWFEYDHEYTVGQFYWGGFDYIGESFGWPCKGWFRGLIDLAGVRKPASYYVESFYSEKPMVRIAVKDPKPGNNIVWNDANLNWEFLTSRWNWPEGQKMLVYTYSNADTVELFLNQRSLGSKKMAAFRKKKMNWDVPFEPGELRAVAYREGKVVAEHRLETAGKASRLVLESDRPLLRADGLDLAHVFAKVVDARGVLVPDAAQKICFSVTGAGANAGVDNGNQNSDELWQANERSAYNGQALLVVRSERQRGAVKIKARAEGLEPAELQLQAE